MARPINPGVYRIRNVGTNDYLAIQGGYSSPGKMVGVEPSSYDPTQKWELQWLGDGTYLIKSYPAEWQLQPGIPTARANPPVLEVNVPAGFSWVFGETQWPGQYFMVKGNEQDQVAQVDTTTGMTVLTDLDRSRSNIYQMWTFEVAS